jgi:hypothetical protein
MKNYFIEKRNTNYPIILICFPLLLSMLWIQYTGFIEDDAFITFRFAEQLANGNGFVYNVGQPIYGTTTPLLTLLLALWIKLISGDVIFGARLLGVLGLVGTQVFIWLGLREIKRPFAEQIGVLTAIAFSSKMIYMSIYGMEIPLITFFLSLSWFLFCRKKFFWAGIASGFLLLTRMDLGLWPLLLFFFVLRENKKQSLLFLLANALVYIPWLIYAFIEFGTPIPFTMIAKWAAYSQNNHFPYWLHVRTIGEYLSPFSLPQRFPLIGPAIYMFPVLWLIIRKRQTVTSPLILLIIFTIAEISLLTFTRATIFSRYFIPILWAVLILFGISVGQMWLALRDKVKLKYALIASLFLLIGSIGINQLNFAQYVHTRQENRYEKSLKFAGIWLKENTNEDSTVLLEPLGYVGYYSKRIMLDEVGLITPEVVELKMQNISADHYLEILKPDYTVIHCDEANYRINQENHYLQQYKMVQEFNPLDFEIDMMGQYDDPYDQIRNSCYQIWERK